MAPRYELAMASRWGGGDPADMKKRALAAVLWFYSTWYAGAMIAHVLGLSEALGPILGTAAAALIAGDPRGVIWTRAPRTPSRPMATAVHTPA
jgi:hypothetical protein